jgi:hypothetical protein
MAHEIVVVQQMGDALRNTGYKSIESAISEIIDNSIEALAKDVFIIISEKLDVNTGRKHVDEIAFLDNGTGMDFDQLGACLGIGFSTRGERRGMGRFGVGLPQSSLYACPCVEVYSWQNGYDNCKKVFLDIEKVKTGEQKVIEDPILEEIPNKYKKFLSYKVVDRDEKFDFMQNGTLVVWKRCDRVVPKSVKFLTITLEFALGQKFRYLIQSGERNIRIIPFENEDFANVVMPNDPLFIMKPNVVLGNIEKPGEFVWRDNKNFTEPLFELYKDKDGNEGKINFPVKYIDHKTGEVKESHVKLTFTKVRNVFYDQTAMGGKDPGSTPVGKKHVRDMEGISVIRAGREIDFGQFDFYSNLNQPQHRWWGCEIAFNPELDEAFGVANNKQHVELKKVDPNDYIDDPVQPMWLQLYNIIHNTIQAMYGENGKTRTNSRTVEDLTPPAAKIINEVEIDNDEESMSEKNKIETPQETLLEKGKEILKDQGVEDASDEDTVKYLSNKVNIVYAALGKAGGLFDYEFSLGNCHVKINTDHIFYQKFMQKLISDIDAKVAFELFIAALVKAIDETQLRQADQNDVLMVRWNEKLRRYIMEQHNFGKE